MLRLVYLVWAPFGVEPVQRFVESYRRHPAGTDHVVTVALKGFAATDDVAPWERALSAIADETCRTPSDVVDLGTYRRLVDQFPAERYCFVNTESVVLADDWLGHLERHLTADRVGMVATTGSYESPNSVRPGPLRRLRTGYDSFPNPHLRSNGFMLERQLLVSLDWPQPRTKLDAVQLECGRRGLSRQVRDRGLATLVVGRDGQAYPPDRFRESATFRWGAQANLLVADKRTRHYQEASPFTRQLLAWLAWRRLEHR